MQLPIHHGGLPGVLKSIALYLGLTVCFWATGADYRAEGGAQVTSPVALLAASSDNELLEKALQTLTWEQFRTVVNAVPKLKADVDAYGPMGWDYVQSNYRTYPWRRNIAKLHETQKKRLAELISEAKGGTRQ